MLHKATVYRHVKATLERAGIDVERMGGRTLRNSFAVRELENGAPVELVKQYMGHHELRSTEKYLQPPAKQRRLRLARTPKGRTARVRCQAGPCAGLTA